MDVAALVVAGLALLFTVGSFWWLHARVGHLRDFKRRTFSAHVRADQTRIILPVMLANSGPVPIVVLARRLRFADATREKPMDWDWTRATVDPNRGELVVQPKDPGPGLTPGTCASKAHDRENLGLGGRKVQVSRNCSGKTLAEHRADRAEVVRQVLAEVGIDTPERDRWFAEGLTDDGRRRFVWEDMPTDDADYIDVVMASVMEQQRWRRQYEQAKAQWMSARASPVDTRSATRPDHAA